MAHLPAATVLYPRTHPLRSRRLYRRVLGLTTLGLAGLVAGLLSGCGTAPVSNPIQGGPVTSFAAVSGNWRVSVAGAPAANALSVLGGSLSVAGAQISGSQASGLLHALTAGQCLDPADTIAVSGSITPAGTLTLTGQSTGQAGSPTTTLTLTGTVTPDRHSLITPTLSVTGGRCTAATAAAQTAAAHPDDNTGSTTAQQYQPVSGTYTGTLTTAEGETFPLTTTVTQLDQPDTSGIYHLQGSAASAGNTCLPSTVTATASILSGGTLSATYTDATGATSITASGSASPDASTLTLTQWQITSTCGSDTGTGTLTRQ